MLEKGQIMTLDAMLAITIVLTMLFLILSTYAHYTNTLTKTAENLKVQRLAYEIALKRKQDPNYDYSWVKLRGFDTTCPKEKTTVKTLSENKTVTVTLCKKE